MLTIILALIRASMRPRSSGSADPETIIVTEGTFDVEF